MPGKRTAAAAAPPIQTRTELINALHAAAELEHGLMAQYLFAAYSLKRYPYEMKDQAQLERVRRWTGLITLIARQEMEHLGLALNLLSAIGGTPSFSRPNMPQRITYYGEADIKLTLTRCDADTIKRFQRFEAPDELTERFRPVDAPWCEPEPQAQHIPPGAADKWCERAKTVRASLMQQMRYEPKPGAPMQALGDMVANAGDVATTPEEAEAWITRGREMPMLRDIGPQNPIANGFPYRSVQELYAAIKQGFENVSADMGEAQLFIGNPVNQIYGGPSSPQHGTMNDLNQYGLDIIGVTDLAGARQAIRMIVEQGEGVRVPPVYLPHTHFCLFTQIRDEMKAHGLGETAARNVAPNPMTRMHSDVGAPNEVTLITNRDTWPVAQLFNDSYEVMLLLLLYLYSDAVKTREQSDALMDAAFFPFMTMFIRPLAEILTELPVGDDPDGLRAGPGFELSSEVLLMPTAPFTWTLFQERINSLVAQAKDIIRRGDVWRAKGASEPSETFRRLDYLRTAYERLATDWQQDWLNIGRTKDVG